MNQTRPPEDTPLDDSGRNADSRQPTPDFETPEIADHLEQVRVAAQEEVLRIRADMENLRKRLLRETDLARRYAGERILADLLPVLDSLEQGLAAIAEADPAREGLELTRRQLLNALEKHGVSALDPTGQPFDPGEHQAISTQPSSDQPENTVAVVLQKGYRLHDRLLRPALVIVTSAPSGSA
jgi:molecular chaperone GrpE